MDIHTFYYNRKRITQIVLLLFVSLVLAGCQKIPFLQKNQAGGLQINTEGSTASVFLNGEFANKTPYVDKNLKVGTYAVKLEPDDKSMSAYETSITIYPNTLAVMNWTIASSLEESGGVVFEMEPLNGKNSALSLTSIPDSTIVNIDNESKGFTPVLMEEITPGDHEVKISLPSYKTQDHNINIVEGMKMHMMVKLGKIKNATDSATLGMLEASEEASASKSAQATSSAKPKASATPKSSATPKASATAKPASTLAATSSASTTPPAKPYVKILDTPTNFLRVRAEAKSDASEVAQVKPGQMFSFFQTTEGWHQIEYATGKKGWVSGQYSEVVK